MFQKLNSSRTLLILALLVVSVNLVFFLVGLEMKRHHGSSEILDIKLGYSTETAMRVLTSQGEYGRRLSGYLLLLDMIYPLIYGSLFILLLYRFMPRTPVPFLEYVVYAFPVIAVVADWLENIWELRMIHGFPEAVPQLAPLASCFTLVKWYAVMITLFILAIEVLFILYYPTFRKHSV